GWDTWTPSGGYGAYPYPGETVRTQGIWYDMGNVGAGFDNDNDGVPDKNAWMQPVGDPSLYDAGCFRLVRTYGIVIVKKQDGTEELIPFVDQLYFEHIPDNTGAVGLVFYEYAALNGVCRGALSPYQEVASGYDNEKFSGDYGAAIQMETKAPLASMSKNAYATTGATDPVGLQDPVLNLSGGDQMLVYQLEITNPNSYTSGGKGLIVPIGDALLGVPVVARDSIPEGTVYVLGTADFIPNADGVKKNGTVLFSSDNGISWSSTEPSDPATVTDIEWWLDESLTSDDSVGENKMRVEFRVTVPKATYTEPYVSNVGCAAFGAGPCFDEDDAKTFIEGENTIEGYVWKDVDSTTNPDFYGDGIMNGTEAGDLSGVPIQVYFDSDHPDSTPGQLDSYDTLWEDKDTTGAALTTDSNGYYKTTSKLPDGDYIVVIGELPAGYEGWANTTDKEHFIDDLGVVTSPETRTAPDTGFAEALTLDKQLVGTSPINEGDAVSYTIDLNNELYGKGAAVSGGCEYLIWSSAESATNSGSPASKQFLNIPNAFGTQGPDGVYASGNYTGGNNQFITGTSFNIDPKSGSIIKVEGLAQIYIANTLIDDSAHFGLYGTGATTHSITTAELNTAVGSGNSTLFSWDVTGVKAWDWTVFANSSELGIGLDKSTSADTNTIYLDALGYRITTDAPCDNSPSTIIDPLPLYDIFDGDKLDFVSASPMPDRVVPYDDGDPATNMYRAEWDNLADSLGPLYPGKTHQVTVNFTAKETIASTTTLNTAQVRNAFFVSGTPANNPNDTASVTINPTTKGSISGSVWDDNEGDAVHDADDNGWVGWTVELRNGTCELIPGSCPTTTTDSSGNYSFNNLDPGTYTIYVNKEADYQQTVDPDATLDDTSGSISIAADTHVTDVDFAYTTNFTGSNTIGNRLYSDLNGDGAEQKGATSNPVEPGIPNVDIFLYEDSGSIPGVLDPGDILRATDVTDGTG
ncbi:MAG: hypothetical protein D3905_12475, partial [Candidatus Electrothrix sp. AS4_5]|nr:hypothetical protein [Candidatus Electrothrix gigas]